MKENKMPLNSRDVLSSEVLEHAMKIIINLHGIVEMLATKKRVNLDESWYK